MGDPSHSRVFRVHGTLEFGEPVDRERAQAVVDYLGEHGVRLTIVDSAPVPGTTVAVKEHAALSESLQNGLVNARDMAHFAMEHNMRPYMESAWRRLGAAFLARNSIAASRLKYSRQPRLTQGHDLFDAADMLGDLSLSSLHKALRLAEATAQSVSFRITPDAKVAYRLFGPTYNMDGQHQYGGAGTLRFLRMFTEYCITLMPEEA